MGNFHPRHSPREMIYIGGGAGMAPLRSHISHWLETENTQRKLSFWYGARSPQELFYQDYFLALEKKHANFSFEVAFSEQSEVRRLSQLDVAPCACHGRAAPVILTSS